MKMICEPLRKLTFKIVIVFASLGILCQLGHSSTVKINNGSLNIKITDFNWRSKGKNYEVAVYSKIRSK